MRSRARAVVLGTGAAIASFMLFADLGHAVQIARTARFERTGHAVVLMLVALAVLDER